jgi:hypothetical protein
VDSSAVLAGPRGRRFCAELACRGHDESWRAYVEAALSPADDGARRRFVDALRDKVVDVDEHTLLARLADAVTFARYWQPPDDEDALLADPRTVEALRPVADAVMGSPAWRWWTAPLELQSQAHVQWTGRYATDPPRLTGAADGLRTWRRETVEDERHAQERPDDPAAPVSGRWWSTPAEGRLVVTSRARPGLGATQLLLVEDDAGWTEAQVSPMRPAPGARVYEIDRPQAWMDLVARHPLEVSRSRRHDWWRTTGQVGRWYVPDWHAVAADHDGVHLTVAAYLATAGRALDIDGGCTVLAGWDPDATVWLTDVLVPAGQPVVWERRDQAGWRPGR